MIDLLDHPPKEFAPVIRGHFKHRGDYILGNVQRWIDAAKAARGQESHVERLTTLKKSLQTKIQQLRRS